MPTEVWIFFAVLGIFLGQRVWHEILFLRLPKPEGVEGEIVWTTYTRYKLTRKIESPIDGRIMGWEAVNDYDGVVRLPANLSGVRRAR